MKICPNPNCGKQFEGDVKFCDLCGTKLNDVIFCPNCGAEADSKFAFCQNCGASLSAPVVQTPAVAAPAAPTPVVVEGATAILDTVAEIDNQAVSNQPTAEAADDVQAHAAPTPVVEAPVAKAYSAPAIASAHTAAPETPVVEANTADKKKSKKPLLAILISAVSLVLVVAIVLTTVFFSAGNKPNYVLYVKDKEIVYTGISHIKPTVITDKLVDSASIKNDISTIGNALGRYTYVTDDGKGIFYIDKISSSSYGIYYRKLNKKNQQPIKIDSDIDNFAISSNGKKLVYISDDKLYEHDLEVKTKIANDVSSFTVSEDFKSIIYIKDMDEDTYTGTLCIKKGKKDTTIDHSVSQIVYVSEDFKTVYYDTEDALYKWNGKRADKVVDDIYTTVAAYDTDEVYFVRENESTINVMDYVEDDMKASDATMKEPVRPTYPVRDDVDYSLPYDEWLDAYYAAEEKFEREREQYQKDLDEYYEKSDLWDVKEYRDELRSKLKSMTVDNNYRTLYYFDGKNEKPITDSFAYTARSADEKAVLLYRAYEAQNISKVKLSSITSVYDVKEMITEALESDTSYQIAVKDNSSAIDYEISRISLHDDDDKIYMIADAKDYHGDLYSAKITGKGLGDIIKIDSDVYTYSTLYNSNQLIYFKNVDDKTDSGDLYIGNKFVDDDVYIYQIDLDKDGNIAYITDYDSKNSCGTLNYYKGKSKMVADDVHSFIFTPKGELVYLSDFSNKTYDGTLYLYKGRKSKQIDTDVSCIIPYSADSLNLGISQ